MYIHNDTECLWDTEYFRGGYRRVTGFYIHRDKRRFIIIGNQIKDVTNSIELKKNPLWLKPKNDGDLLEETHRQTDRVCKD